MRTIGLLILGGILMTSCVKTTVESAPEPETDGVFIHISEGYNDAHKALMPLKMATIMGDDKDVLIYMDIHAVNLLVKGSEDLTHDGFESAQTYFKQLLDMGVGIYACPTCLKVAGFEAADLMDGIKTAEKDKFFNFTKGRIITLDY
jgi:predicted peroxiredoxin